MRCSKTSIDSDAAQQAYYAQRAPRYEEIYQKPERLADLERLKDMLRQRLAGRTVLDVACGTGYFTQVYAPLAAAVVGVDSSSEVLDLARAKHCPNTRFIRGDAFDLDTALAESDAGFDAALLSFWWSHLPRAGIAKFLSQLHRQLLPGARVIVIDNRYVAGSSTPISHTDDAGDQWQDRPRADGSRQLVRKNFPGRAELVERTLPSISTHWWSLEYYWWFEYKPAL
jgi:demethylmenaquinone methyltransferase/2-methoxy-6-polyprenyl-1,4-benzoquinol methylase